MVNLLRFRQIRGQTRPRRSNVVRGEKQRPSVSSSNPFADLHPSNFFFASSSNDFVFQRTAIVRFAEFLEQVAEPERSILVDLLVLFILKFFEENLSLLFESGYATNGELNRWMENRQLDLCAKLRHELVALVDVFAPPDHILNSVLGRSDGDVYRAIDRVVRTRSQTFEIPSWIERSKL